ncbi:hypothetical protein [Blastopirellula marina]|uniref:Carboxypeptidase regulatory-like domain-containing protein n=1 Tax=Blastopirellula marina TaxID=124 RepID=A0A2S8GJ25_9BACT|nr:hypothetical protein [Blastopirellula marina]PQO44360.1 hypothetical protein C5Y93_20590 [Blastopirellula marina]
MRAVALLTLAATLTLGVVGCGGDGTSPPLGEVTGHITLNGEPLDGATVEFIPESGRPSIGVTDASGNYELLFKADMPGAMIGKHSVRITSQRSASGGEGAEEFVSARKETVPAKYNDETTLEADVKSGDNKLDFPLEGKRSRKASPGA